MISLGVIFPEPIENICVSLCVVFIYIVFYKLSYSIILQPASGIFHSTKLRRELSTLVHRNLFFSSLLKVFHSLDMPYFI